MNEWETSAFIDRDAIGEQVTPDMISAALAVIETDGMIDGAHHKQWVLDQVLRVLLGAPLYQQWRARYDVDSASNDYALWEEGIAP